MTVTRNDNRWFTFTIEAKPLHSTPPHWEHKGVPFKNLIRSCQRSCWHWSMTILISCKNWWKKGENVTPTCLFLTSAGAVFSYWRKLFSLCTSAPILEVKVSLVISQLNNSRHNSLPYLQMVLKNIKNSPNFPLVEAPWPVKPSSQIVRDFSEEHGLPPAGVSDYKYQMEKRYFTSIRTSSLSLFISCHPWLFAPLGSMKFPTSRDTS